jgi:hypothetical protein
MCRIGMRWQPVFRLWYTSCELPSGPSLAFGEFGMTLENETMCVRGLRGVANLNIAVPDFCNSFQPSLQLLQRQLTLQLVP